METPQTPQTPQPPPVSAGTEQEPCRARTLAEALEQARARHADRPRFAQVLGHCSFLVDGYQVGDRDHAAVPLREGATVEVLPPFAGG
ncbi:MoaD/ThiS family protein [Streptomyces sp. NBC_00257]|uniref:MoaD/ThiS family protein n=1 Tax=unclassified Streptomyces TaxID=2593676 RepID=UPI0022568096|nr:MULTISPECIES: MoaD/ThiS family protein [unclassified Streptomyces]MCX5433377.1 MoaD/ThiS family protein [Streptomyces sp. NBC_00062]